MADTLQFTKNLFVYLSVWYIHKGLRNRVKIYQRPCFFQCLSPNNLSATLSRATKDVWRERSSWKSKNVRSLGSDDTDLARNGSSSSSELLLENGLSEAVTDFEEALQRTRPQSKILSYEIPDSQKFHTFPRIKTPALRDPVTGTTSNLTAVSNIFSNRATSGSTSTNSASTVVMRDSLVRHSSMEMVKVRERSKKNCVAMAKFLFVAGQLATSDGSSKFTRNTRG